MDKRTIRTIGAVASLLLVYALVFATPSTHLKNTQNLMASAGVGISVGVPENPYNTLAQQLAEKENELTLREEELAVLESRAKESGSSESSQTLATYSLGLSALLFLLLAGNFYMDWRRGRRDVTSSTNSYAIHLNKKV